jgi:hypothetical protein
MSEKVKVTVIKGSIGNAEVGSHEQGDVFETTRTQIANIDASFIQVEPIIILEAIKVDVKPLPKTTKKASAAEPLQTSE